MTAVTVPGVHGRPGPGARIGPYELVMPVGRGGMGVVFEARHLRLGQRVALKLLADGRAATDPAAVRRFVIEATALGRLEHACLVRVIDCGESDAYGPWIAMEYLAGESLRARLERAGDGLAPLVAVRTVRRIAAAVAAIHRAGIVHRDLKPENIMLVADDEVAGGERVKLLDFGIAKLLDRDALDAARTAEGTVLGTAAYMAPEQCLGTSEIDGQADVYALGVIAFELLCGEQPFRGDARVVMSQHLVADPPLDQLDPALPRELVGLVGAMLAKEPTRRPASDAVVARLLGLEDGGEARSTQVDANGETQPGRDARTLDGAGAPAPARRAPRPARQPRSRAWRVPPIGGLRAAAAAVAVAAGAWWALRPAAIQRNLLPSMVAVEGARFVMGSTREEIEAVCAAVAGGCTAADRAQLAREQPAHEVEVSAFQLDTYEVTNADYAGFLAVIGGLVDVRDDREAHYPRYVIERSTDLLLADLHPASGGIARDGSGGFTVRPGRERLPVVQVTWDGASRYCRHLGKRLPTEAEWELAARGVERRPMPWGGLAPRCDGVVFGRGDPLGCPALPEALAPVGTSAQDVTPAGVRDLGGNAGEWVEDQFVGPTYGACGACRDPVASHAVPLVDDIRMFRGGTLSGPARLARGTTRSRWLRTQVMDGLGFRCATR